MTATAVVFIVLAVVDLRRRRLPHLLTAAAWVTATATVAIAVAESNRYRPAIEAVGTAAIVAAALLGLALAMPGQLGLGDVNLISVVAFSLGWSGWTFSLLAVVVGLLVQAVVGVGAIAAGFPRQRALPLGPATVAGWLVGVVALNAT
jgi:leader peptidase (prepilin peptidase)/N-methyltransferase